MVMKKIVLLHLLLLSLLVQVEPSPNDEQHIQCKESERQVLLQIKRELLIDYNFHDIVKTVNISSWSPDEQNRDCCRWGGVECSSDGHVVSLNMAAYQLKGGIPKSFSKLCKLRRLDLSFNILDANLPDLIYNISGCLEISLEVLKLRMNQLRGFLPDISLFSSLQYLDISLNRLDGSLPRKFAHSSKLFYMDLSSNKLTGPLPESISSLSQLSVLDLSENSLQGTISDAHFASLSKLQTLDLSRNSLSLKFSPNYTPPFRLDAIKLGSCNIGPEFPKWLQTQKSCSEVDISSAKIDDTIPGWFWKFSSRLKFINVSFNGLYGQLPPDLSSKFVGEYVGFDLSSNHFHGLMPLFRPNTTYLNLSQNKFSGNISALCDITKLNLLDLSNNLFSGTLPDCFGLWEGIRTLNLANNFFTGVVSASFSNLATLDLYNNSFYGDLPSTISNCRQLMFLDLSHNRFSGDLPCWIGQLQYLIFLNLESNLISGNVPNEFCRLENLQLLGLSENKISGTIPRCLNNLTAMTKSESTFTVGGTYTSIYFTGTSAGDYATNAMVRWKGRKYLYRGSNLGFLRIIDFARNNLSGEIPEEITRLVALKVLNLSRNRLDGGIPRNIGELKQIEALDLSRNLLAGDVPKSISGLSFLSLLDLSYNNFSGEIPTGTQLQGFNASSFEGNSRLCGLPLLKKCKVENSPAGLGDDNTDKEDNEFLKWMSVGIGLGFAVGFWAIVIVPMLKTSWRHSYLEFLDYLVRKLHTRDQSKRRFRH